MRTILSIIFLIFILPHLRAYNERKVMDTRLKIAVVDNGIAPNLYKAKYLCRNQNIKDVQYGAHGTNVAGLIGSRIDIKKYCLLIYDAGGYDSEISTYAYTSALKDIGRRNDVVGLNLSISSKYEIKDLLSKNELALLKVIDKKGVKTFIAAGNKGVELKMGCSIYPACHRPYLDNARVIGNTIRSSNYGPLVDEFINGVGVGNPVMTGSSQSTAIATGSYFSI